jgi:predicted Fe-Mo cluster-binding NifX family protein
LVDREGTVADRFGGAPFFAIATISPGNGDIEPTNIFSNPHCEARRAKGIGVAEWLVEQKTDVIALRDTPEKGPRYVFGDAAVTIRIINAESLKEALIEAAGADGSDLRPDSDSVRSVGRAHPAHGPLLGARVRPRHYTA